MNTVECARRLVVILLMAAMPLLSLAHVSAADGSTDSNSTSDKSTSDSANRTFMAGAAAEDITPPLGETIVGSFIPFPATTIHDRLHARCLMLDDGQNRIAIVLCDSVGIAKSVFDEARELIAKQAKISPANVLMAATHSHSATRATSEKYRHQLAAGIAKSVASAEANLEPAKIGWGSGSEPSELFNRRWFISDKKHRTNPFGGVDQVRMNPPRNHPTLVKPAGPTDPEVSFVSVQSKSGRPIALLANYSLHYVGGVNKGEISADYFAIFTNRIGELLSATDQDKPFVGIMSNGTSGDVNNINFRDRTRAYEKYEKMTEVANKVADCVYKAHQDITFHDWVPVGIAAKDLTLQVRKPDAKMQAYFADVMSKDEDAPKHHRYERIYADRVKALQEGPDEIAVPLQAIRIGDLGIAAIPFEVFTEIGLEIKKRTPMDDAFTIELANDSRGYLPTPTQHKLGGYETWMGTNRVEKQASEKITSVILELMQSLK